MRDILIYSGKALYSRGTWVIKDNKVKEIEPIDDNFKTYNFGEMVAKSLDQLVYLLGLRIKSEMGITGEIYVELIKDDIRVVGSVPSYSKEFDELYVGVQLK